MADTFLRLERPEAAAIELGKYHKLYESRQWNPNAKYNELVSKLETLGIPLGNPNRDNTDLYRCYLPKSLEFVYSDLPIEHAIVDNVNEDKQLFHVISLSGKTSIVYYRDTELRPNVGDILSLRYMSKVHKETGNVSWKVISMSEDNTGDTYGLKKEITSGRLKVSLGKNGLYGFVTEHDFSAYVPSYLLRKMESPLTLVDFLMSQLSLSCLVFHPSGRSSPFALLFNIKTKDFGKTTHETSKTHNLKYLKAIIFSCSSVMFETPAFFIRENSSLFLLMTNLRSHPSITAYK